MKEMEQLYILEFNSLEEFKNYKFYKDEKSYYKEYDTIDGKYYIRFYKED